MEHLRLLVESDGAILFPESVQVELDLQPGDLFTVTDLERSLRSSFALHPYRDVISNGPKIFSLEKFMYFVLSYLDNPLAAVDRHGAIHIPPEACPLPAGTRLWIYVSGRPGLGLSLSVSVLMDGEI